MENHGHVLLSSSLFATGLIIYFGYSIRHSKENANLSSFTGLLKEPTSCRGASDWGSTLSVTKDLAPSPTSFRPDN